ncbi:hypothetical protein AC579_4048 [Pseudocercospora musae]|uniref:Uncharacterized protein n=1 Tax=Pseudocercospora musae TaxID=113226 RepID=A0A139IDY4_9PEZI|nr:hypothetical protein AC579_4048 [Pseudocercospora musae]
MALLLAFFPLTSDSVCKHAVAHSRSLINSNGAYRSIHTPSTYTYRVSMATYSPPAQTGDAEASPRRFWRTFHDNEAGTHVKSILVVGGKSQDPHVVEGKLIEGTTAGGYDAAKAACVRRVHAIVRECQRNKEQFTDPEFDLKNDFYNHVQSRECLRGLPIPVTENKAAQNGSWGAATRDARDRAEGMELDLLHRAYDERSDEANLGEAEPWPEEHENDMQHVAGWEASSWDRATSDEHDKVTAKLESQEIDQHGQDVAGGEEKKPGLTDVGLAWQPRRSTFLPLL